METLEQLNQLSINIECTDVPVIIGIDEAGRGPAIGPMVYGMYVSHLKAVTNYKDSKLLTPKQRTSFFEKIKKNGSKEGIVGFGYYKIHPAYITSHMEARSKNLNEIAKEAVVRLLKEAQSKCKNIVTVYIDGLGDNKKYEEYLKKSFNLRFVIENKADSKYQVVSGASIVAKVVRDMEVEKYDCGSGYPADPVTKKWLNDNKSDFKGFPEIVRHSWKTVKNMMGINSSKKCRKGLEGFFRASN